MDPAGQNAHLEEALRESASTGLRVVALRLISYVAGFVASVLIARSLGPLGRGLYAYPLAFLGIAMVVAHVGLEQANVYLASTGVSLRRLWANASAVGAGIGLLIVAAAALAYALGFVHGVAFWWVLVPFLQAPFLLQSMYWASVLQLDGRLATAALATVVSATTHALLVAVLFALGSLTPFRVLLLLWSLNGTTWLLLLGAGVRAGLADRHPDKATLLQALGFGLRAYAASIFFFLLLRVDQLLVRGMLGYEALGLYTLSASLAALLWLLTDPLAMALLPHQVRATGGDDRRLGDAVARLSLAVALAGASLAWVLAPYAIRVVYGASFAGSVWPFRLLLPGVVALAAIRPLGAILLRERRPLLISGLGLGALAINVALNLLLLRDWGIAGAAVSSSVCYLLLAAAYVQATRRPGLSAWGDLVPRAADVRRIHGAARRASPPSSRRGSSEPLRVLLIIGSLRRGGTEGQVAALAQGLRGQGCEVAVLCLQERGELASSVEGAGVAVHAAGFHGLTPLLNPLPLLRVFRGIHRTIRSHRPDVVQCFLYWGYLIGVPMARLARVPMIVSTRRSLAAERGGRTLLRPVEMLTDRVADAIVCNSEAVRIDSIANGGVPAAKVRVVANGVMIGPFVPMPSGAAEILVIANLIAYKGHDVLLRAFRMALDRLGRDGVTLHLAGRGVQEARLRELASSLGLVDRVRFMGSVGDVRARLDRCSFTVLPSLSEGMPNAVLESMAAGRAVVATAVGGVPELLRAGGGILVPPADVSALAGAIRSLLLEPERARAMGETGRRVAAEQFGMKRMVDGTLALYHELLGTRGQAPARSDLAAVSTGQGR